MICAPRHCPAENWCRFFGNAHPTLVISTHASGSTISFPWCDSLVFDMYQIHLIEYTAQGIVHSPIGFIYIHKAGSVSHTFHPSYPWVCALVTWEGLAVSQQFLNSLSIMAAVWESRPACFEVTVSILKSHAYQILYCNLHLSWWGEYISNVLPLVVRDEAISQ